MGGGVEGDPPGSGRRVVIGPGSRAAGEGTPRAASSKSSTNPAWRRRGGSCIHAALCSNANGNPPNA